MRIKFFKQNQVNGHGGKREKAGRKPGVKALLNKKIAEQTDPLVAKLLASGPSPLEVMFEVMRDPESSQNLRLEAAGKAAVFCHRKQPEAHEHKGLIDVSLRFCTPLTQRDNA